MALDPKYVLLSNFEAVFRDKDTGLPLSDGYILFSQDEARTVGKTIYALDGTPPAYDYVPYGFTDTNGLWRVDLSDAGVVPKLIYAYPYDADGNIQLYFYQVFSSDATVPGVFQYSAEAIPNTTEGGTVQNTVDQNFIPNGQFLLHTDIAAIPPNVAGQITQAITPVAYGGWTFERPIGSTAKDIVLFERFGSPTPDIVGNPRYAARVINEVPSPGDTFKDLRVIFGDVNKFASLTQEYTFAFTAVSNTGGGFAVDLILIKNYGTGGSTQTETTLGTVTFTSSEAIYSVNFVFGDNSVKTIGPDDDDFLQLAIRFPLDAVFDGSVTDAILGAGIITQPAFPVTPDSEMVYQGLAGFMQIPAYDGSNAYLPLILTPSGISYDSTSIGDVITQSTPTLKIGRLAADGSQYETAGVSADQIPYARLQAEYYDPTINYPLYGTGPNYNTADLTIATTQNTIRLSTNSPASVADTADGTPATGFTFATIHKDTGSLSFAYVNFLTPADTSAIVAIYSTYSGTQTGSPATTVAGWTIGADNRNEAPASFGATRSLYTLTINSAPLAGDYVTWDAYDSSNVVKVIVLWFKVNGAGTAPVVPGDVVIELDLLSTYGPVEVAKCINEAVNNRQQTTITTVSGGVIPAGSYWTFQSPTIGYYVWYQVGGVGIDPAPPGYTAILVSILSSDSDVQVALKTQIAINSKYFAVPNYQGMYLRSADPTSFWDRGLRLSSFSPLPSNVIGTFEADEILTHNHESETSTEFWVTSGPNNGAVGPDFNFNAAFNQVQYNGTPENRTINTNVFFVIKY